MSNTTGSRHGSAVVSLPSDTEYLVTRVFDAPAAAIFEAHTNPDLVKRWWGFESSEWLVCDIDLRVGGSWRYLIRERDMEVGFHGSYHAIEQPTTLVYTEMYEMPDAPLPDPADYPVVTMRLDEQDGVTTMTVRSKHTTQEERDTVIASGMESGMQVSYDRLEDLVSG